MNNPQASIAARDAMLNAITALLNGGTINYYTGSQPASPDTAISSQTLLCTDTFNATAFGSASAGSATANAITTGTAGASGTVTWCRCEASGGTAHLDLSVGTASADVIVATTTISSGNQIPVTSFVLSHP